MKHLTREQKDALESVGISISSNGKLSVKKGTVNQAATYRFKQLFGSDSDYLTEMSSIAKKIKRHASQIVIPPKKPKRAQNRIVPVMLRYFLCSGYCRNRGSVSLQISPALLQAPQILPALHPFSHWQYRGCDSLIAAYWHYRGCDSLIAAYWHYRGCDSFIPCDTTKGTA